MTPLFGITWLFGLLMPLHNALIYIFTILNSTQVNYLRLLIPFIINFFFTLKAVINSLI